MTAILGGGLGGLAASYYLSLARGGAAGRGITLLEASGACGGWIRSVRTKDYVFEVGPRTIRPAGITLTLLQAIGLANSVVPLPSSHPAATNRLLYARQHLHPLPRGIKAFFSRAPPFSRPLVLAALQDLCTPRESLCDDSIYNFAQRRFGQEIADYAVAPLICGICAGDAKEISVKFLMKTLFDWEQTHGGVLRGYFKSAMKRDYQEESEMSELARRARDEKWNVYALKGGLQTLPETLQTHLEKRGVKLHVNSKVTELEFLNTGEVTVKYSSGSTINVSHVYSSIPAYSLANLVQYQHPALAEELRGIPYVTVAVVNLHFKTEDLIIPAFGFLVPPIENSPILGVVFDSCCTPNQSGTVLTVMMGGRWFTEKFGEKPYVERLLGIAIEEVKNILNIHEEPAAYNVNILNDCIPQYVIGHYERVKRLRGYIQQYNIPISLVGSSYDGIGINDVISSAKKQVDEDCV